MKLKNYILQLIKKIKSLFRKKVKPVYKAPFIDYHDQQGINSHYLD